MHEVRRRMITARPSEKGIADSGHGRDSLESGAPFRQSVCTVTQVRTSCAHTCRVRALDPAGFLGVLVGWSSQAQLISRRASLRKCRDCEHYGEGMEPDHKPSVISRLLDEVSWEGSNVKRYRDGGRGMENPLTAEVFQGLSNLPRDLFLGEVLRCAHGADQTRLAAANEAEHADLDVLPGSLLLPALNIDVQPDVWVTGPSVQLLVEAKGFRKGATFNVGQLPRELLCLQAHSGNRTPLLLLVLTTPHPSGSPAVAATRSMLVLPWVLSPCAPAEQ